MAHEYYVEDFRGLPFGVTVKLFRQMLPWGIAYPLAIWYRLRDLSGFAPLPGYASGPVGSGRVVDRKELNPRIISQWAPLLEQLHDLGFVALNYRISDSIGSRESAVALFLDSPGTTFAFLQSMSFKGAPDSMVSPLELISFPTSDPEIMTGMIKDPNPILTETLRLDFVDQVIHGTDMRLVRVYASHQERIRGRSLLHFDRQTAEAEYQKRSQRRFDALLRQRLVRRLSESEVKRLQAAS